MAHAAAHRWHTARLGEAAVGRLRGRTGEFGQLTRDRKTSDKGSQKQYGPLREFVVSSCPGSKLKISKIKIKKSGESPSSGAKILQEAARCYPRRPWGHAFLDKYRPWAPGGLRLQQPGKRETESLRVPTRPAPGGRRRRRAARTRGAPAGGGGEGAGLPRGADARTDGRTDGRRRADAAGPARGQAGCSPPDRRTDTDGRRARRRQERAGRKRAKVTSPRALRGGLAFSFPFSFLFFRF